MFLLEKIQKNAFKTDMFDVVTSVEELNRLFKRIPEGGRVTVDTEGSPYPFCIFLAFLDVDSTLVYGSVAVKPEQEPSVLDLKFQAGVGWRFRPAGGDEVGIDYEFIDPDGTVRKVTFEDGMSSEKDKKTIITVGRVATADQMRSLANGDAITFSSGKVTFQVTHDKAEPLYAAEIPAERVTQTGTITHLIGDPLPAYQNLTLEQVLTRRLVPVDITPTQVRDGCFYALELADATGKKTDYVPVHPGCSFQKSVDKPLVRILPKKGEGSTIDLPTTNLDLSTVQGLLQTLVTEKQVTFAAHQKAKEEKDLAIQVRDDSFDIVKRLAPFMEAADMKPVGSSPVLHLLHAILKNKSPIVICGESGPDLVTCSDIHSLPVEVCVLTILYPLLEQLTPEWIKSDLRASVSVDGEDKKTKVEAALESLTFVHAAGGA